MKIIKWIVIILGIILAIIGLLAFIPVIVVLFRCGFCGLCDNGLPDSSVTILGTIPTVLLALLTLIQTQHIHQVQDSWTRENTKRPFFIIDKITGSDGTEFWHEGNTYKLNVSMEVTWRVECVSLVLKNIGEGIAVSFKNNAETFGDMEPSANYVQPGNTIRIRVSLNVEEKRKVILSYQNIVGVPYEQSIEAERYCQAADDEGDLFINNIEIHEVSAQRVPNMDNKKEETRK